VLCAGDRCGFLFEFDEENIVQCPDCGKLKVRLANKEEIKEFQDRVLEDDLPF
jgi:predicted  nucleic acid-binding Zn-ribbon protein